MMINLGEVVVVAEHSVILERLPHPANVLDIGCRGFLFTNEMRRLGHYVVPVDIDILPEGEHAYFRVAIAGKEGTVSVEKNNDPQATKIKSGTDLMAYTIEAFTKRLTEVEHWDLIKMDVEGAEYEIIMSLTEAPAKQLSIEFHLHTGAYTIFHMNEMEIKLGDLGYTQASHDYTDQHGAGLNYWDSLFILMQ